MQLRAARRRSAAAAPNARGKPIVAIAASPAASPLPAHDITSLLAGLQQAVTQLSQLITQLQAQGGTGAIAGAATLGGGPAGAPVQHGCGCGGAQGAAGGVEEGGRIPPPKGAKGAPQATGASGSPEQASGMGQRLMEEARKHMGKAYRWGADGPDNFDCSGLMMYVAKQMGIDLPRVAKDQAKAGRAVERSDLQAGDLVYFQGDGRSEISHIGMYVGDGKFIHAPKTGDVVKVSSLDEGYYARTYRGARRIS
jgi:cell wall-associated NlpC family hydrolase